MSSPVLTIYCCCFPVARMSISILSSDLLQGVALVLLLSGFTLRTLFFSFSIVYSNLCPSHFIRPTVMCVIMPTSLYKSFSSWLCRTRHSLPCLTASSVVSVSSFQIWPVYIHAVCFIHRSRKHVSTLVLLMFRYFYINRCDLNCFLTP